MVESATQVMDDFAGKDAESRQASATQCLLSQYLKSLPILIGENWLQPLNPDPREWSQKLRNLRIEITDVLIGPF